MGLPNERPDSTLVSWREFLSEQELRVAPVLVRPLQVNDAASLASIGTAETFQHFITVKPSSQDVEGYANYINGVLAAPSIFGFVVFSLSDTRPLGSTCFLDMRPEDKHVEIGLTWYAEHARGTKVNPACKLAMLDLAFDGLGCERVTLKCDSRNIRSRNAISKLGAVYEGTLRKHKPTGPDSWRDTSYYSIIKEEWQEVQEKLLARLAE